MDTNVNGTIKLAFENRQSCNFLCSGRFSNLFCTHPLLQYIQAGRKSRIGGFQPATVRKRRTSDFCPRRQECPEITYTAMGFWPHSFPVGGMYLKDIGRLVKVKKKLHASLFHCFLNGKSTSQILHVYLTGKVL